MSNSWYDLYKYTCEGSVVTQEAINSLYKTLYGDNTLSTNLTFNSNEEKNMSSLTSKFVEALTPEPMRSFRKAGITNGDNLLTEEGTRIFLSWLLNANADMFKREVVDQILDNKKKEA